jgi:hypothetical protein
MPINNLIFITKTKIETFKKNPINGGIPLNIRRPMINKTNL